MNGSGMRTVLTPISRADLNEDDLNIEIPDALGAVVKAQAQAEGVSPDRLISRVLENTFAADLEPQGSTKPFETATE